MRTIQEVFSSNLRRLRGDRTQAKMAELAGIPFVSYQRAENGDIPQRANLEAIAAAFGVPETHLFVDMDEFAPKGPKARLIEVVAALDDMEADHFLPMVQRFLALRNGSAPISSDLFDSGEKKKNVRKG